MRTRTDLPLSRLVTLISAPSGKVRCAAGQTGAVVALAARSLFPIEMLAVHRCQALLDGRQGRAAGNGSADGNGSAAAAEGCQPGTYATRRRTPNVHGRRSHYLPAIARRAPALHRSVIGRRPTANVTRRRFRASQRRATLAYNTGIDQETHMERTTPANRLNPGPSS